MKIRLNFLYLIIALVGLNSCANQTLKKANREYEHMHLQNAIKHYNKVLEKKPVNIATVNIANSYFLTNDYKNARHYYKDAVYMQESDCGDYINYAKILMHDEDYDEAKVWLDKFLTHHPDDLVAKMLYASCNSISDFYRDTTLFELHKMEVDGFTNTFSPTELNKGVVFSGDKEVKLDAKTSSWTGNSYLDLYFTEKNEDGTWLDPAILKGDINGKYHEGPAVFTKDGKTVYFTRNNYKKRKLNDNSPGENNLKLYSAELVGEKWTNIKELPFNSDFYSVGHPALNEAENKLYFISDMPGGIGGTDVWMATKNGEEWSKPENLGETINTQGNEMFPYYHNDGSLYFSSDAHHSMGGLDVFISSLVDNKWLEPENLNYPLNSSKDDFGFVLSEDNKTGYVSSSRTSVGGDALYEFVKHPPKFNTFGLVTSKLTQKPLAEVSVVLSDLSGKTIKEIKTTSNGKYRFKLEPNGDYKVFVRKEGFFAVSQIISTVGKKYSEDFEVNLSLDELIIEKPIVIENIYYDYDKWFIREDAKPELDKLVKIMEDNPRIIVELSSHTDSRASGRYNIVLSDKRAHAAVEYILTKGISQDRISAKGYGETKLLNDCKDNVECTEEQHQINRRTEFKVTKLKD
jgi:outer membrane protein OmpA-like peptidoglycan-associated protein/tetratricopeptide (TPR) repeat protein